MNQTTLCLNNFSWKKLFIAGCGLFLSLSLLSCTNQPSFNQPQQRYMPPGFVYLDDVTSLPEVNLVYATPHNFVGRPLKGYDGHRAILRTEAAHAIKNIAEYLNKRGLALVIYDAYRPHTAVMDIGQWGLDAQDQKMKSIYYPNIDKKTVFGNNYLRNYSEHSRGVAVDVSLRNKKTGKMLNMGGYHDLLDPSSATAYSHLTAEQKQNRQLLKSTFERYGFLNYSPEWWHYYLKNEPDINSYFLFPIYDEMAPETKIKR